MQREAGSEPVDCSGSSLARANGFGCTGSGDAGADEIGADSNGGGGIRVFVPGFLERLVMAVAVVVVVVMMAVSPLNSQGPACITHMCMHAYIQSPVV